MTPVLCNIQKQSINPPGRRPVACPCHFEACSVLDFFIIDPLFSTLQQPVTVHAGNTTSNEMKSGLSLVVSIIFRSRKREDRHDGQVEIGLPGKTARLTGPNEYSIRGRVRDEHVCWRLRHGYGGRK